MYGVKQDRGFWYGGKGSKPDRSITLPLPYVVLTGPRPTPYVCTSNSKSELGSFPATVKVKPKPE